MTHIHKIRFQLELLQTPLVELTASGGALEALEVLLLRGGRARVGKRTGRKGKGRGTEGGGSKMEGKGKERRNGGKGLAGPSPFLSHPSLPPKVPNVEAFYYSASA